MSSKKGHDNLPALFFWKTKRGFDRNSEELPVIVVKTCEFLEKYALHVEGLFRVNGPASEIHKWKKKFDDGKDVDLNELKSEPHVVAGILKLFLKEPEESIFTDELYDAFLETVVVKTEEKRVDCLREVIMRLPIGNKLIVHRLFRLLRDVAKEENSQFNKMTSKNLAICFSPTLLRKREQTPESMLSDVHNAQLLIESLIQLYEKVFAMEKQKKFSVYHELDDSETRSFYVQLKRGSIRLARTALNEMEQRDDIADICRARNIQEDNVDVDMINEHYQNKIKKEPKEKPHKRVSLVFADIFMPPSPGEIKEKKPMEETLIRNHSENGSEQTRRRSSSHSSPPSLSVQIRPRRLSIEIPSTEAKTIGDQTNKNIEGRTPLENDNAFIVSKRSLRKAGRQNPLQLGKESL